MTMKLLHDPIAFQVATLWPQLPDDIRVWCVPRGDETAKQRAKRVADWRLWLAAQPWAQAALRRAVDSETRLARIAQAQSKDEREAFRVACRAAGLTGPMSAAKRAHLLGIWRRAGRIEAKSSV